MRWLFPLGIAAAAVALELVNAGPMLELDRARVLGQGEWWRLLTCHGVHFGTEHLVWDAAAFAGLGVVAASWSPRRYGACVALSAAASAAAVLLLLPGIETYRGLSAIDSALFALLATLWFRRAMAGGEWRQGVLAAITGAAFLGKTALEAITGETLFVDAAQAGFVAVPFAHLVGGACGCLVGLGFGGAVVIEDRSTTQAAARWQPILGPAGAQPPDSSVELR